jgi:hypothetical protein
VHRSLRQNIPTIHAFPSRLRINSAPGLSSQLGTR